MLHAEEITTVTLPAVTVLADLFMLDYVEKDGVITHVQARDVTRGSKPFKGGLRDGDVLVSIFGQRIAGMKKEDVEVLLARLPGPGAPKTFRFIRKRGLFRSGRVIDVTFSVAANEAEKTDKPPEPRTGPVTNRADARP